MVDTLDRTKFDITILKNRDFVMNAYLRDADNEPIDVTDWTGQAQVRETKYPDSKLIFPFVVNVYGLTGKIEIFASKVATTICQDKGYWDLVLTNTAGRSDSYAMGDVILEVAPTVIV